MPRFLLKTVALAGAMLLTLELLCGADVLRGEVVIRTWSASPLAHLPNQYYNWGVFVPDGYQTAPTKRWSLFFHARLQRFLKPAWPHRSDTVLLAPHDAPYRSYGYG